jgi:DNA helicase-2/ATP-dependent DNA helicase PcrA
VLLGKVGVVERGVAIVDWRDAPISQLWYTCEGGEDYCEEIAGRQREGVVTARRRADVRTTAAAAGLESATMIAAP